VYPVDSPPDPTPTPPEWSADAVLIGLDIGATRARASLVLATQTARGLILRSDGPIESRVPRPDPTFTPLPLDQQLENGRRGQVTVTDSERQRGLACVDAATDAVCACLAATGRRRVLLGVCAPGLRTGDGRGISVMANGPRMPLLAANLEAALRQRGVELLAPLRLASDADCCGLGERYGEGGLLADVENAYYLGSGTGLAEALMLRGRVVSLDACSDWLLKAWQMISSAGPTYERLVSAAALNRVYADRLALSGRPAPTDWRPEQAARRGDPIARQWLAEAGRLLAELIAERIETIRDGRGSDAWRGSDYLRLNPQHPFRNLSLQRVVVGQQLGRLLASGAMRDTLEQALRESLDARRAGRPPGSSSAIELRYSSNDRAGCIGAALSAWCRM